SDVACGQCLGRDDRPSQPRLPPEIALSTCRLSARSRLRRWTRRARSRGVRRACLCRFIRDSWKTVLVALPELRECPGWITYRGITASCLSSGRYAAQTLQIHSDLPPYR